MRASIAIASYNEGDLLWKTVRSCRESIDGMDCEVVVADDASSDGSIDALRRRCGDVSIVSAAERGGTSRAKDRAVRAARGDVVVLLDAHCKPEPGAIARLVRDVEDWGGDAIVTPGIEPLDAQRWEARPTGDACGFWLDLEWLRCGWLGVDQLQPFPGPDGRALYRQPAIVGCCLAMSRELYAAMRGFDTGLLTWGIEDIDLGLRAWMMDHPVLFDPEAVVAHRFRGPSDGTYSVPPEHWLHNQLRMARKAFGDAAWDDWSARFAASSDADLWRRSLDLFEAGRADVEAERDFLMSRRVHDEFWYAAEFGLAWPLSLSGSPYPSPAEPSRPRFSGPVVVGITDPGGTETKGPGR